MSAAARNFPSSIERASQNSYKSGSLWCIYDSAHISQTYVALCSLLILGDDLANVDREAVLKGVASCQMKDGRYFFYFSFIILILN